MDRQTRLDRRGLLLAGGALALTPGAGLAAGAQRSPVVTTTNGRVRGARADGVHVFKGLRYGADTGGARRFMPPVKPQPWTDVQEALAYGAASPQSGRGEDGETLSEDCLFLNVWTPATADRKHGLADGGQRPVMVYIHGGAYNTGSGGSPLYDGTALARRGDVVVVTVNHRLNAFGYLYLARLFDDPGVADSGNVGQLDLVLALQWVRDNIAAFGGDPGRVMLFGQSGGGAKVATLMAMPAAGGLFHRAATMSGQQVTAAGPFNATHRAQAFLDKLGIKDLAALRALPAEAFLAGLKAIDPVAGSGGVYMGPVLDERSLSRHPFFPDAAPQSLNVPMMCGNTHDETRGFVGFDRKMLDLTWDEVISRLPGQFNARIDIDPATVVAAYRRLYPHYSPSDVYFAASTAGRSWKAAIIQAEERARAGAPAYVYQVDWRSPRDGGVWGAPHTIDIALVFGTLTAKGSLADASPESVAMSNQMSDAFIAFARTGNPNGPTVPTWEPYTLPRRQTMVFNTPSALADDPRGAERELFNKVPFTQFGT
ncbi:carboxylesterase/lipase family protein [Caulobacter henricii]|uniref:Carboxylic ester hydrolase n=1 Tax=Caulobacter henricii TaxID=69395 RepID=A0A0P0P1G7_9CAUL|nr:carboxylesterase/lipase family protein [Caulobacter henricii]ALL14329.1 carboxylesterase [Caulobacter henricii]